MRGFGPRGLFRHGVGKGKAARPEFFTPAAAIRLFPAYSRMFPLFPASEEGISVVDPFTLHA